MLADESNPAYDPDSAHIFDPINDVELKEALDKNEEFPSVTAEFYDQDTRALCIDDHTPLTDAVSVKPGVCEHAAKPQHKGLGSRFWHRAVHIKTSLVLAESKLRCAQLNYMFP